MKLTLTYDVEPNGWATFRLVSDEGDVSVRASYLLDSLRELIEAAAGIAAGLPSMEATFVEEPGQVVLRLDPGSPGETAYRLVRFPRWPQRDENAATDLVRGSAPTHRFLRQVATLAESVRSNIGEAEYQRRWRETPFPAVSLMRLHAHIKAGV